MMSPGASSSQSILGGDSKKESVQVFVRVRPPFTNEIDEDAASQSYFYPPLDYEHLQQPLWSCV